jgi:hypothetical protein
MDAIIAIKPNTSNMVIVTRLGIQSGEVTHHQDHVATEVVSVNLSIRNTMNKITEALMLLDFELAIP